MNKILLAYYTFLTIVLISWSDPVALPPFAFRLAFLLMVVVPLYIWARDYFVPVLFFFVILSSSNHAVSYMPVSGPYLAICTLAAAVFFRPLNIREVSLPKSFYLLLILVTIVDLSYGYRIETLSFSILLVIIASHCLLTSNTIKMIESMKGVFVLISLILSVEYFIWGDQFTMSIAADNQVFERMSWSDPNYFSCLLGFGPLISINELVNSRKSKIYRILFYLITFILTCYVMVSMASRGAIVALSIALIVMALFSDVSVWRKICLVLFLLLSFIALSHYGVLDLLFARFSGGDGTAGSRTLIWATKWNNYSRSDFVHLLFGYGLSDGLLLGYSHVQGFHNDYLAFLVCYGIVGLLLFLGVLLFPLLSHDSKVRRKFIIPYLSYVAIVCLSLEPISSGSFIYLYWFLLLFFYREVNYSDIT